MDPYREMLHPYRDMTGRNFHTFSLWEHLVLEV